MHIGSVVHRYIQRMAEEGIEVWDSNHIHAKKMNYEMELKRLDVAEDELEWASKSVIEALARMIVDERGRWILQKEHTEQHNEYPLSGLYDGKLFNIIIDRTFVDDNDTRWIVDYKTSRHEGLDVEAFLDQEQERYREQLEKYGALMSRWDNRKLRLGLYFPLLQGWREWEYITNE